MSNSKISIPITVSERDLKFIGGTIGKNWFGGTEFYLDNYIELIILRTIMSSLGYRISEPSDVQLNPNKSLIDNPSMMVDTDYPYTKFNDLR